MGSIGSQVANIGCCSVRRGKDPTTDYHRRRRDGLRRGAGPRPACGETPVAWVPPASAHLTAAQGETAVSLAREYEYAYRSVVDLWRELRVTKKKERFLFVLRVNGDAPISLAPSLIEQFRARAGRMGDRDPAPTPRVFLVPFHPHAGGVL